MLENNKATVEVVEKKIAEVESGAEVGIKAAASKAIEDFRMLEKYHDEKVEFVPDAYIDGK